MKLLVITQKVDRRDSNLGSFHEWIYRLAGEVEKVTVICLQKGEYDLPTNVEVLSLGKETGVSRLVYVFRFYWFIMSRHKTYDGVFVHMNQIYVILGSLLWKLGKKPVLLWYVHRSVSASLKLAVKLVNNVFTTSPESFRLPSLKVEYVGHGISVERFNKMPALPLVPLKLVSTGRITASKDLATIIRALAEVRKRLPEARAVLNVVGEPVRSDDQQYYLQLQALVTELGLAGQVIFTGKVLNSDLPTLLAEQSVFIHASQTGSVDKALLEALSARLPVVTSSEAFQSLGAEGIVTVFKQGDSANLANTIEKIYRFGILKPNEKGREYVAKNHNLSRLIDRIITYFVAATSV